MPSTSLSEARAALVAAGITGRHRSHPRAKNIDKIHELLDGDDDHTFGLSGVTASSPAEVLAFLAELTGCPRDIADLDAEEEIDPDRTIDALVAAGRRLKEAAERGETLLAATGHPTGLLYLYIRIVEAFRRAGGKVVALREEEELPIGKKGRHHEVRYVGGVGCLADWGSLKHTHSPDAMEALLEAEPWPDIVLGDHGFAGAAIERGIPTIAVMDINDHALAVAWGMKKDVLVIPLDDNRPPALYEPACRIVEDVLGGRELGE